MSFTERSRQVLAIARETAIQLGHDYVAPEHILLAVLREGGGAGVEALGHSGANPNALEAELRRTIRPGKARSPATGELPYTSFAKNSLETAMAEARDLGHSSVGTEHIVLGAVAGDRSAAGRAFRSVGGAYDRLREAVAALEPSRKRQASPGSRSDLGIEIDDESDRSIFQQIVDGVKEAAATGRAEPGDRLPTVRALADQLDVAPGTVARAYRTLEEEGVIVTEGARGTRLAPRQGGEPNPDDETLVGLLRPVAVAAFHLGASADQLRRALDWAMKGIFEDAA